MTQWGEAICETNQISMHYTRTGGNKPVILLLHGLMGDGRCWGALACLLQGLAKFLKG